MRGKIHGKERKMSEIYNIQQIYLKLTNIVTKSQKL